MDTKRANEVESQVAKALGFKRVSFSGAKWYNKEDIRDEIDTDNENSGKYLVQVKATDTTACKMALSALNSVVSNAKKYHKKPLFVVHFDRKDALCATWVSMPIEHFVKMKKLLEKYEKY